MKIDAFHYIQLGTVYRSLLIIHIKMLQMSSVSFVICRRLKVLMPVPSTGALIQFPMRK